MRNISCIDFVGIVDRMDESIASMNSMFGWSVAVDHRNRSSGPKPDKTLMRLIQEKNELDMELYNWSLVNFGSESHKRYYRVLPNKGCHQDWINGIRVEKGNPGKAFYFLTDPCVVCSLEPGDRVLFEKSGVARVVRVERKRMPSGQTAVFVTTNRVLDPLGDGYPDHVELNPIRLSGSAFGRHRLEHVSNRDYRGNFWIIEGSSSAPTSRR
jgi:hypothetical protein